MGELREFIEGLEARYNTAHAQTGTPAMINPGGTFSDAPEPEGALRIRLPVEWRAALVRVDAPEIPVTPEMMDAASRCFRAPGLGVNDIPAIYRAMAALAPGIEGKGEAERARAEVSDAYRYLRNIFEHVAPQCTPLDDLMGICTQIDNALAGAREEARASGNRAYIAEGRVRELSGARAAFNGQCDRLTDDNSALGATNERLRDEISALTAEKNALHDALAIGGFGGATPGIPPAPPANPNVQPPSPYPLGESDPPTTKGQVPGPPNHNPFREFPGDRRRIGG